MRHDGLGQALEGIKAFASLGGGAIILWVVYAFSAPLLSDASEQAPGGLGGAQMNDWFTTGLDTMLPALFLGLVFFGLIASAILASQY